MAIEPPAIGLFILTSTTMVYTKTNGQHPAQDHSWPPLLLSRRVPPREWPPQAHRPAILGLSRHPAPTPPAAPVRTHPGPSFPVWRRRRSLRSRPATQVGGTHRSVRPETPAG